MSSLHRKGKNLKPALPKEQIETLPSLSEPNDELRIDFEGTIPIKNNVQSIYILVTVDGVFRYPKAETFNKCETKTAIEFLEFHGIPKSIRCDQAQPFKAREFIFFAKIKSLN